MSRRRLVNSYFYVMYNNQRVERGGTLTLPPFEATGGVNSFTVHSSKAWTMGQKPTWINTNVSGGNRGATTVNITAEANPGEVRNGSTNIGPVYFLDSHYITIACSQNSSSVEYRNLTVSPASMSLTTSDTENGKAIHAYVDVYINGTYDRNEEVTSLVEWLSNDTDIANCYQVSGGEVVKPNYDPTRYHPATSTTVQARYLNSAATCNVNVAAEGRIEYELDVTPTAITISNAGIANIVVTAIAYRDGIRYQQGDVDITDSSSYVVTTGSDLISVNRGTITGLGSPAGGTAVIRVSNTTYTSEYVDVMVTVMPASYEYRNLTVNPNSMTLTSADTNNGQAIHAYVDVYINGTYDHEEEVTTLVEWSSDDTDIANCYQVQGGEVVKPNYNPPSYYPNDRYVDVRANYLGSAATCEVTVKREGRLEYEIAASPLLVTIDYDGEASITVMAEAYLDGERYVQGDVNVTNSSSYAVTAGTGLITVNQGFIEGQGVLSGGTAVIRITNTDYASNDAEVVVTVTPNTCVPGIEIVLGDEIAGGYLPQSGGSFTVSAITSGCAIYTDYSLNASSSVMYVTNTDVTHIDDDYVGITFYVYPNSNKESGRDGRLTVWASGYTSGGAQTVSASTDLHQNKADWEITDADYITFKYNWSGDTGGKDLDTFTFIQFDPDGDSPYFDGLSGVGYDGQFTIPQSATISASSGNQDLLFDPDASLLVWAGDNRGTGAEHTLINLNNLFFTAQSLRREDAFVYVFANWYTFMGTSGNCNIELTGWKEGRPLSAASRTTGFTIEGGEEIKAKSEVSNVCYARRRNNCDKPLEAYTFMSVMHYHVPDGTVYLYSAENIDPDDESLPYAIRQYCGQYGYHRAWDITAEVASGGTVLSSQTRNQHAEPGDTIEFSFSGESSFRLTVNPDTLYYSDDAPYVFSTTDFAVSSCTVTGNFCEIINSGTTFMGTGMWFDIHLNNNGTSGETRRAQLRFSDIKPIVALPDYNTAFGCDTLYIEIFQYLP